MNFGKASFLEDSLYICFTYHKLKSKFTYQLVFGRDMIIQKNMK